MPTFLDYKQHNRSPCCPWTHQGLTPLTTNSTSAAATGEGPVLDVSAFVFLARYLVIVASFLCDGCIGRAQGPPECRLACLERIIRQR
ncbi:hypothetical protein VTJ83DRAFT_7587 [Remersonia thermophila]|uniref:Uncharacterized protein n=1 Tax=Remersonia thermophila TaxID=72144 RepID=A0ABR4D445_9PEZI